MSTPEFVKDAPSLLRDRVASPDLITKRIPQVKIETGGAAAFDYKKEIERMAGATQSGGAGLQIDFTMPPAGLFSGHLDVEGLLLEQAREHVRQKEFQEGLAKLDKLLAEQRKHPEANFLRAICFFNLDSKIKAPRKVIRALQALREVDDLPPRSELLKRLSALRDAIRGRIHGEFPVYFLSMDHGALADEIDQVLALDPGGAIIYAFRAILLLERGQTMPAYEAIEAGIRAADNDDVPVLLIRLRASVAGDVLYQALAEPIAAYKQGQYDRARKEMARVDPRFTANREYQLFAEHLKRAGGGGFLGLFASKRPPSQVSFDGPADEDRWLLQRLIVRDEIDEARSHIERQELEAAEEAAHRALSLAPRLPLACYYAAGCGLQRISRSMVTGEPLHIDEVLEQLPFYSRLADSAAEDRKLVAAAVLVQEIRSALEFFEGVQAEFRRRRAEVELVNGVIQEFVSLMKGAERGIDSVETLRSVRARMEGLRARVRDANGRVTAEEGRGALRQVGTAVEKNLEALEKISATIEAQRKQMAVVEEAARRLHDLIEKVKDGVESEQEFEDLRSGLERLKRDLPGYRRRLQDEPPKKHLDALEKTIDNHLGQITELKSSFQAQQRDRSVVEAEAKAFQGVVARMPAGGFSSRSELSAFRQTVDRARDSARSAKSRVRSRGAEGALDQLVGQYDGILAKIDSIL